MVLGGGMIALKCLFHHSLIAFLKSYVGRLE